MRALKKLHNDSSPKPADTILSFCVFRDILYIALSKGSILIEEDISGKDLSLSLAQLVQPILPVNVDAVVTMGGPETFTTLRILIASCYGFAAALHAKSALINSFDILEAHLGANTGLLLIETRSGRFFCRDLDKRQDLILDEKPAGYTPPIIERNPALTLLRLFEQNKGVSSINYMYKPLYKKYGIKNLLFL